MSVTLNDLNLLSKEAFNEVIDEQNTILSNIADNLEGMNKCIVCSPTQPTNLKNGLWIETYTPRDIKIANEDFSEVYTAEKEYTIYSSYIIGPMCSDDKNIYTVGNGNIYMYNVESNVYTTISISSTAGINFADSSNAGCCAYYNGLIYASSGISGDKNIYTYDTINKVSSTISNIIPVSLYHHSICVVEDKLYIMGGYDQTNSVNNDKIYIFDPINNSITTKTFVLSSGYMIINAIYYSKSNCIYAMCRSFSSNKSYFSLWIYNLENNNFTLTRSFDIGNTNGYIGKGSAIIDGNIYFAGFYSGNNSAPYNVFKVNPYYNTISNISVANGYQSFLTGYKDRIYFTGNNGNSSHFLWCFDTKNRSAHKDFYDSFLIKTTNTFSNESRLMALEKENDVYKYECISAIWDIDEEGAATNIMSSTPYKFHKIRNFEVV